MKHVDETLRMPQKITDIDNSIESNARRRFMMGLGAASMLMGCGLREASASTKAGANTTSHAPSTPRTTRDAFKGFTHPGLLHSELDFSRIRNKIKAGEQPWLGWWETLCASGVTDLKGKPNPQVGVYRYTNAHTMYWDIQRAYCAALRWKLSDDTRYADLAIATLDAWSAVLKEVWTKPAGSTAHEDWTGYLLAGIQGHQWANVGEIMRTYSGWAPPRIARFQKMLRTVFALLASDWLDSVATRNEGHPWASYANWDLAALCGVLAIGVFCDDLELYNQAISYYTANNEGNLRAVFGNGAAIHNVYFMHPGYRGQWQESGRDQGHSTLGMTLCGDLCEMAWHQGDDLYAFLNNRFLAGAEYVAESNLVDRHGKPYPMPFARQWSVQSVFCAVNNQSQNLRSCWEPLYNHYVNRLGYEAPNITKMAVKTQDNVWSHNGDDMIFAGLMHRLDSYNGPVKAPSGLSAVCTAGKVVLSWWGGMGTASYLVRRSGNVKGPFKVLGSINSGNVLTFADTPPEGVWFYQIEASNTGGQSETVRVAFPGEMRVSIDLADGRGTTATGWGTTSNGNWVRHDGTLVDGADWGPGRKSGHAVAFDGKCSYVQLPSGLIANLGDFSVAMWIYINRWQPNPTLLFIGDDGGAYLRFAPICNKSGHAKLALAAASYLDEQVVESTTPTPVGCWVHLAVTLSGNMGKIYVDGKLSGSNGSMLLSPHQLGDQVRMLGRDTVHPAFDGRIQDFHLYSRALSSTEIASLAQ